MNKKTLPILFAFLCMGFGDVVGPLVGLAKDTFELTNFLAMLLTFSGFIMFGLISVPTGVIQAKKGKKKVLMTGLSIALIGLLIPIFSGMYGVKTDLSGNNDSVFYIILFAILLLGTGATLLQVAGNPIMRDVSDDGNFSSNLSLGQSIKAIGSSLGFLLPPAVLIWLGMDWSILFPVFAGLILITLIWLYFTPIKEEAIDTSNVVSLGSCLKLLGNRYIAMMVVGIFIYVGAEVTMSSQVPILMKEFFGFNEFGLWISWSLFFLPIFLGRLFGSFVLKKVKASIFLKLTIIFSIIGLTLLLLGIKTLAFAGIVLVGLGFANIFPLIFSITIDKYPERSSELSGLMVTAIVGGAFIPPIAGFVADLSGILLSFVVPFACLMYLLFVSLKADK
ncbi:MAG: MFS transporter [Bacteroidetes bacterium]|nr:MFS transporter [Bacteroidota bacterium]